MADTASPTEKQALAEWLTLWIADCDFEETSSDYAAAKLVHALAEAGYAIVPREPTAEMVAAACKSMSPGRRPTPDRVSVREKHSIRWRAMVEAAGR